MHTHSGCRVCGSQLCSAGRLLDKVWCHTASWAVPVFKMGYQVPVCQGGGEPLLGVDSRRRQQVLVAAPLTARRLLQGRHLRLEQGL